MSIRLGLAAAVAASLLAVPMAHAQEAVVGVANPEALFHSKDPKLNRNKQAAYHIETDLLESHRWNEADKWLTQKYIQHNPQAASGLPGAVKFFTEVLKQTPLPLVRPTKVEVVAVIAEGDYVNVMTVRHLKDAKGNPYTSTWFDTWRFVDGKADEHWDPATLPTGPAPAPAAK